MEEFRFVNVFQSWPWWLPFIVVVGAAVVFHFFTYTLYKVFYSRFRKSKKNWQAMLIKALHYPFTMFVWFSALSIIVSLYAHHFFDFGVIRTVSNLIRVGLVVALAWGGYIFIMQSQEVFLQKRGADKTTVSLVSKLSVIVIVLLTTLLILPIFGIEIGGLLAFGGFSGIVVGFAARDTISNLLSGFILAIDKPFLIGDWVHTVDGKIDGVVEEIGWRLTVIRDFDKKPYYMPNASVVTTTFVNASRMTNRRMLETVTIRYKDQKKVPMIVEKLNQMIKEHPEVDQAMLNFAALTTFGESSLEILLRAYTKTVRLAEFVVVRQDMLLKASEIIQECGGDLAFPTTRILLEKDDVTHTGL